MSLPKCKIRRSTDSIDLLNANYVSAMSPLCMQLFLIVLYNYYMSAQSFIQMLHPYDNTSSFNPYIYIYIYKFTHACAV